jgi:predicted pyridoxine 5'-phosphate oxidase superfamily flavin-nucleotide-binding protein
MSDHYREILFSADVRAEQERMASRHIYARSEGPPCGADRLGHDEAAFIAARTSFYLATIGANGWPYIQHRGGPQGFVRVLDERTLGFGDFRGNRQYITLGNLKSDNRASLFFMDYANRARLKLLGRIRVVDPGTDKDLAAKLSPGQSAGRVERLMLIDVEAFDWNCSQHIPQFVPLDDVRNAIHRLQARISELEAELQARK